jgi:hypothetical protein
MSLLIAERETKTDGETGIIERNVTRIITTEGVIICTMEKGQEEMADVLAGLYNASVLKK